MPENRNNFNYTNNAFNKTESLIMDAMPRMKAWTKQTSDTLFVFNPTSWERTDLVYAPMPSGRAWPADRGILSEVKDLQTGASMPFDIIGMSEWGGDACGQDSWQSISFVARNVPPMGYRAYLLRRDIAQQNPASDARDEKVPSIWTIENSRFRVEVEPATGAISSIFDKGLQQDLLLNNAKSTETLFNYLASGTPMAAEKVETKLVEGKTFKRLEIRRSATWFPETDIRLTEDVDHVEVRNVYDREAWKKIYPSAPDITGSLMMPFSILPAKAKLYVSSPNGYRQIPDDLFPNSIRDCWASSAFIALTDGRRTIMVSSPTDYIFMPVGPWETSSTLPYFPLSTRTINEGFEADTRNGHFRLPYTDPALDGRIVRRYAITSHEGAFDVQKAQRFGWGFRQNMLAQAIPGGSSRRWRQPETRNADLNQPAMSFVKASDLDVWVVAMRRSLFPEQDFYILRLQETAGRAKRNVRIQFAESLGLDWAAESDMVERKGRKIRVRHNALDLSLGPFETRTIALGFVEPAKPDQQK